MAKALGVTMCLLSVCGKASNTRRCTCGLMRASVKPATPLDAISISTIPSVHIRALTARRPIRPTSPCCRSARRPNPGRGSTHRRGNSVQRIGTTAYLKARRSRGKTHTPPVGLTARVVAPSHLAAHVGIDGERRILQEACTIDLQVLHDPLHIVAGFHDRDALDPID